MLRLKRLTAKVTSSKATLYMHFHKLNEFIGLTRLPTFLCNDVIKNPQVEQYLADYQAHLEKVFG